MNKVIVIGNSLAAIKSLELIRKQFSDAELTVISSEGCLPYDADFFPSVMAKDITMEDAYYQDADFYKTLNIEVVTDVNITRVNLENRKIYTSEKRRFDFDALIVANVKDTVYPRIKGSQKNGVRNLRKISDLKQAMEWLPLVETVAIQSDSALGLDTALALAARDKEVYWIVPSVTLFPEILDKESSKALQESLRTKGIHVVTANSISEVLGDTDMKALRLTSGKVVAAQMVFCDDQQEDLRFLKDNPIDMQEGCIQVNAGHESSIENVFAVEGAVGESPVSQSRTSFSTRVSLETIGGRIAAEWVSRNDGQSDLCEILNDVTENTLSRNDFSLVVSGHVLAPFDDDWQFQSSDGASYIRLFGVQNHLSGGVFLNTEDALAKFIQNRQGAVTFEEARSYFQAVSAEASDQSKEMTADSAAVAS